jgi:hypothetical protein
VCACVSMRIACVYENCACVSMRIVYACAFLRVCAMIILCVWVRVSMRIVCVHVCLLEFFMRVYQ